MKNYFPLVSSPALSDWRSAIKLACRPLEQQGKISAGYAGHYQRHGAGWPLVYIEPGVCATARASGSRRAEQHSVLSLLCCAKPLIFRSIPAFG
jgi:PTS system ascorbate-specific IIA component